MDDRISPDVLQVARVLIAAGFTRPEPGETDEKYHTVQEVAAQLRVHESTVYRAIQRGILGAIPVGSGGRGIRIPAPELEAFKARRPVRGPRRRLVAAS